MIRTSLFENHGTALKRSGTQDGWTLVETLAAVTIVLLLSATVGVVSLRFVERGREAAARNQMALFSLALEAYHADVGRYPTTEQGLDALWQAPTLHPGARAWDGPYIRRPVRPNPWGKPYEYRMPGPHGLPYDIATETGSGSVTISE